MSATHTPVRPPVVIEPDPMKTSARMTYRLLRHILRSTRRGDLDFVREGTASLARIPLLMMHELVGSSVQECNISGWTGPNFYPNTGPGYHERATICPGCRCQDRHRSLLALLLSETTLFTPGTRVVEVAPMAGFEDLLRSQREINYTSFDLARHAMEWGDITNMRFPTESVDYFICFHVLEHVPDEKLALAEMHRVLKPGGVAVIQVPVDWHVLATREYAAPDPRDVGHVRRHGADFSNTQNLPGATLETNKTTDLRHWQLARKASLPAPVPALAPDDKALVSVIIPCYNYGHFLPQCISSVLAQKNVQLEVIIVDDKSTDDSAEVAAQIAAQDQRIAVIAHPKNAGHVVTFNTGLAAATGEFIVRLDADDLLTPGSPERAVALFRHFPAVGLVYGHPRHFTTAEPPIANETVRGWSVWSGADWVTERCRTGVNVITTPEAIIRSEVFQSVGGLDTRLSFAQDMEMWLRAATWGDVGRVDGPDQAFHRDHAASMSATSGAGQLLDLRERLTVFDVLFSGPGGQLPHAARLHDEARRVLAAEALVSAYASYDRGQAQSTDTDGFIQFALEAFPAARTLPQWRALSRRRLVGARLAPYVPFFTASLLWRRRRWRKSYQKWVRTGLF